jgi:competence ComEA-like helix-hairpin-helix protein
MRWLVPTSILAGLAVAGSAQELPKGKGGDLLDTKCTSCHTLARVTIEKSRDQWEESVKAMIGYGAELTPAEEKTVVEYLAKYFGEQVNVNEASAADLQREFELTQKEAEALVQTRKDKGPFKEWNDLSKVPGLDMKKLEDLRDRIKYN